MKIISKHIIQGIDCEKNYFYNKTSRNKIVDIERHINFINNINAVILKSIFQL